MTPPDCLTCGACCASPFVGEGYIQLTVEEEDRLGHKSLQSTEMYLRADPTQKLEAVNLATPLPLRKGRFTAPDRLIDLLRTDKAANNYAKRSDGECPWISPRRRLTVHNQELR